MTDRIIDSFIANAKLISDQQYAEFADSVAKLIKEGTSSPEMKIMVLGSALQRAVVTYLLDEAVKHLMTGTRNPLAVEDTLDFMQFLIERTFELSKFMALAESNVKSPVKKQEAADETVLHNKIMTSLYDIFAIPENLRK